MTGLKPNMSGSAGAPAPRHTGLQSQTNFLLPGSIKHLRGLRVSSAQGAGSAPPGGFHPGSSPSHSQAYRCGGGGSHPFFLGGAQTSPSPIWAALQSSGVESNCHRGSSAGACLSQAMQALVAWEVVLMKFLLSPSVLTSSKCLC